LPEKGVQEARVSRRGADRWRRGHPWIYRSDVLEPGGEAGATRVLDPRGRFLGVALWSPASTISLRLLTPEDRPIDRAFWGEQFAAAAALRARLRPAASAYRLVHAEADRLPSLVADRYGDVVVVQLLSAGIERHRADVLAALHEVLQPAGVLARNDVAVRSLEGLDQDVELLAGVVPEELEVAEAGVRYLVAPRTGQKTGAFLDQRENRVRAGELAGGKALDCFSYHGSFALHLARSAREVTAVDSSAPALARALENARLNGFDNLHTLEANVFDFLRAEEERGARYDTVVLDPPAFAKRRDNLDAALRGYKEINLRALRILAPGGVLCTFSCSYHVSRELFRNMLAQAASDAGRPVRWVEERGQAADHPEVLQIPESGYLKGAVLQVL
jgi:23S rRNA (cytosine1962-C5)-methyltransferase